MDILGLVDVPAWAIILLLLASLYYWYASRQFGIFEKMGVRGPKPWIVVGNILIGVRKTITDLHIDLREKYGRVYGLYEGSHPLLIVGDVDMLKDITVKHFNDFPNRRDFGIDSVAEPPVSHLLTVLRDDDWRHNRHTLTPTYSGGKLKKMTGMILEAGQSFVSNLEPKADQNEPIEMKQYTGAYTLDVIAATAFGIKLDTRASPNDPFVKYARKFLDISLLQIGLILLVFFPSLSPLVKILKLQIVPKDSVDFFSNIVQKALEERRKTHDKYSDFLQSMINAEKEAQLITETDTNSDLEALSDDGHWKDKRKGKGLSDSEILAASILFFTAGSDTTASTLAFFFHHLAMNPDVMDRLIEEIDQHYPDGKSPDYETVGNLTYLEMVLMETLRINPPLGRMDRVCSRDTVIGGIPIPKGMAVALPIYMIHHDPGYWPDPEVFNPERFTPKNREKHHPLQWIPFGYGPRHCIGMRLALFEMKMVIVQLLQKYRFVPNTRTAPLEFDATPLLSNPKKGVWLSVEHRRQLRTE